MEAAWRRRGGSVEETWGDAVTWRWRGGGMLAAWRRRGGGVGAVLGDVEAWRRR